MCCRRKASTHNKIIPRVDCRPCRSLTDKTAGQATLFTSLHEDSFDRPATCARDCRVQQILLFLQFRAPFRALNFHVEFYGTGWRVALKAVKQIRHAEERDRRARESDQITSEAWSSWSAISPALATATRKVCPAALCLCIRTGMHASNLAQRAYAFLFLRAVAIRSSLSAMEDSSPLPLGALRINIICHA